MKKRRTTIIAVLLIAALALGIGYAALNDELQIAGEADITLTQADEAFEADIFFSRAVMGTGAGTAEIREFEGEADDMIYIEVADGALKGAGSYVICTAEVKNAGDLDALVTLAEPVITGTAAGDEEYFTVTTSWAGGTAQVNKGSTMDLTITITCIKTPTKAVGMTFTMGLTAESVEALS